MDTEVKRRLYVVCDAVDAGIGGSVYGETDLKVVRQE